MRFGAKGIHFVDCPVSGGAARAHAGELTMMASGDEEALSIAKLFLSAAGKEVHLIPGGAGMGQKAKVNSMICEPSINMYFFVCSTLTSDLRYFLTPFSPFVDGPSTTRWSSHRRCG